MEFQNTWENRVPEENKLTDDNITEFVQIVFDSAILAINSRSDVSSAMLQLATLRPAIVVPPLLEKLHSALESLTEPHRLIVAMQAVSSVARPMLCGADAGYKEGLTHVVTLLMATLPGLDPNDVKKTLITLQFLLVFSWLVPLIDCSKASEYWPDLTEEEQFACESTAQFEDFVLLYLERIFNIIEFSSQEHVRLESKENECYVRNKLETIMESAISTTTSAILSQCSPKIFKEALRKFKIFAFSSSYEPLISGSIVSVILKAFARVDAELTLTAFVPQLCEELTELLTPDEILQEQIPPRDLLYRLQLLSSAVDCNSVVLMKYIPTILPVVDRGLMQRAKDGFVRAADVLGRIMYCLSQVELRNLKSVKKDYASAPKEWLPVRYWGRGCKLLEADFEWHLPNEDEVKCAQMLIDKYLVPEINKLKAWLNDEIVLTTEQRQFCFILMHAATSCTFFLKQPDESDDQL